MPRFVVGSVLALSLLASGGSGHAQTASPAAAAGSEPQIRPTLDVRRVTSPITVDGAIDDAGWQGAAHVTGFVENFPNEMGTPPVETEAWIAYDDEMLYVAFSAHDDDPAAIRTSIRDRDLVWQDDYACLFLDTYGDSNWGYTICANPDGVQLDTRLSTTTDEDDTFDIVFQSEGRITGEGYDLELGIPFKSLRFPDRPSQTWRATFWRTHPRGSRAQYTWAAIDRDDPCFLCQWGTLTGIEGVQPGGSLELFPSVVASYASELEDEDDPDSGLESEGFDGEASLGARYVLPQGITLEGTINPDFSQVESDVAQIDANTTFALFFPERRPFFQEGSDLFSTFLYFNAVYTRQINDPQVAVKMIGRLGRTNIGYLGARDEISPILIPFEQRSFVSSAGASVSNIVRLRQTYGESSYVGGAFTDRRLEGGDGAGTLYGVDGVHFMKGKYRLEYAVLGSHTVEPDDPSLTEDEDDDELATLRFGEDDEFTAIYDGESFSGFGRYTSIERDARFWNFDFDYEATSPTFRTENGFEERNDTQRVSMFQGVNLYPEWSWLDALYPGIYVQKRWTYDGDHRSDYVETWLEAQLKRQTFAFVNYQWDQEVFGGIDFDGMRRWTVGVESRFSDPLWLNFEVSGGEEIAVNEDPPVLGEGMEWELSATFRPVSRLSVEPTLIYSYLDDVDTGDEIFSGTIFRTRTTYNLSRELFMRFVIQYDEFDGEWNVEPLVTYRINPFTLFFVGSTQRFEHFDDDALDEDRYAQASRQFFAKFQYLFQL